MNFLVHDDPPAVGRLVRSALAGRKHRVSVAESAGETRRKLETGLFDALVIGAGGAPRGLAEFLEAEWPELPLVLAGVERDIPCAGPIVAVLSRPIRLEALREAVRALETRIPSPRGGAEIDAELLGAEGVRVPGRVVGRGRGSLLFEPSSGADGAVEGPVTLHCGMTVLEAQCVFTDAAPRGGARCVGLRVGDPGAFERFAKIHPGGVAC